MFSFGKRASQHLVAANAAGCQPYTSRLFYVIDKNSGLRFLVDTGAEVSLLPISTIDRRNRKPQQVGPSYRQQTTPQSLRMVPIPLPSISPFTVLNLGFLL